MAAVRRALLVLTPVILLIIPLQLVEASSGSTIEAEVDVYIDYYDGYFDVRISDPDLNFKHGSDPTLIVGNKKEEVEYGRTAFTNNWHEGCSILDAECVERTEGNEYRILLRPSLDEISGIVTSAKIVLTLKRMDPDHDVAILAYPLTAGFNEAEATWIYRDSGVEWASEGGDYDPSSLLDQVVVEAGSPPGTVVEIDVTDYVRAVRQGQMSNLGVILVPGPTRGWAEFYSTESPDPRGRPKLVVETLSAGATWTPPPPATQPPAGGWTGPTIPRIWWVSVSPSDVTVSQGGSVSVEVRVEALGVSPTVTLSASGIPPDCAVSFGQAGGSVPLVTQLTIATSGSTPAGEYNVTVQAASSSVRSATLSLKVVGRPSPDFRVVVRPPGGMTGPGGETSFKVAVAPYYGFSQPVTISVLDLPPGCSYTVSRGGVPPLEAWVNVSTSEATPPGVYKLRVEVSGGGVVKAEDFVLIVARPQRGEGQAPPAGTGGVVGQEGGAEAWGGVGGEGSEGETQPAQPVQGHEEGGQAPEVGGAEGPSRPAQPPVQGPAEDEVTPSTEAPGGGVTLPYVGTVPLWLAMALGVGILLVAVGVALSLRRS